MNLLKLLAVWVAIVACFTGYAFLETPGSLYSTSKQEGICFYVAIGISAASYVAAGLVILKSVRFWGTSRGIAVGLLLIFAIPAILLPIPILSCVRQVSLYLNRSTDGRDLFGGEHGMMIAFSPLYSFWITLVALAIFVGLALGVRRTPSADQRPPNAEK